MSCEVIYWHVHVEVDLGSLEYLHDIQSPMTLSLALDGRSKFNLVQIAHKNRA